MAQYELNFQDYWRTLSRRKLVIAATFIVVAGVTVYYNNSQSPVYRASAQIRVERPRSLAGNLMESMMTTYYENPLVTEAQVIQGRPIAEEVARRLRLVDEKQDPAAFQQLVSSVAASVYAEPMRGTSIITVMVTSSDPERAYQIANLTADVYVERNLFQKNAQARKVREFIESQLQETERRLHDAEEQQKTLREKGVSGLGVALESRLIELQKEQTDLLARATPLHPDVARLAAQIQEIQQQLQQLPHDELEYTRVAREVRVSENSYSILRAKLEEARIAEAEKIEDAHIVNPANRPGAPIRPNKRTGYLIGTLLGLLLGFVMAFVVENLDTSLGTIEDVEELLHVPVLGVIPHIRAAQGGAEGAAAHRPPSWWRQMLGLKDAGVPDVLQVSLFTHFYPTAPEAEAFRTLRTNLKISEQRKLFMITSAGPKEGKTSIVSNLGVAIGQAGSRVALVASDLRKPQLPKAFGIRRDPGLVELLSGALTVEKATRGVADFMMGQLGFNRAMQTPGLDNVFVLPSGHIPSNPSELIGSKEMQALLVHLRAHYDVVILDSPPILPIADALQLAPLVDGVVLVYEVGRTARAALVRTKTQLENAGGKVIGVILNHVRPETHYPAYYYYRYRYYASDKEKEQPPVPGKTRASG